LIFYHYLFSSQWLTDSAFLHLELLEKCIVESLSS